MKIIPVLLCLAFFSLSGKITAQTTAVSSGIYLTAKDFQENNLMEEADCKNNQERFEKHDFFSRSSFVVVNKGKKSTYQKKNIYAYRDCDNRVWRFYEDKEYEIREKLDLYIYVMKKIVLNGRVIEKDPVYYFSNGPGGEIKELNSDNLKVAYPDNKAFHSALDTELSSDKAIHSYDTVHTMYKVNYLFSQSKK